MRFLLAILLCLLAAPTQAQQGQGMSNAMVVSSCGGGAAPSGVVTNLTMDATGRLCQSGIGSNVCTQAAAYLARTTGGNEGGNAVNITALICGLVIDGVIDGDLLTGACGSHLDALYILAQQNQTDALLNLCGTNYNATNASAIFTSYKGFNGFTSANYIDTGFNPTVAITPNYTLNNASFGIWSYATISEGVPQVGIGANVYIFNDFGNLFYPRVNDNSNSTVPTAITKGLFAADRTDATNVYPYQNGVTGGTLPAASAVINNATFIIGTEPGSGGTAQTLSEAHFGGSLGSAGNLALYNRLRTYMTAVGVP